MQIVLFRVLDKYPLWGYDVENMDTIIFCQDCGKAVQVPPGSLARRRYCDNCSHLRRVANGRIGGHIGGLTAGKGRPKKLAETTP